jgi:hypothetical protein
MHRIDEKCINHFSQNLKGSDQLGDLSVNSRIILKLVLKK